MIKKLTKTNISLLIFALCAILLCGLFAINNFASKKPSATAYETGSNATLKGIVSSRTECWWNLVDYDITNLVITNTFNTNTATGTPIDVSEAQDGSLYAYKVDNGDGTYNCVIYANVEKIYAPKNSHWLFSVADRTYKNGVWHIESTLETIKFECFDTSRVTDMAAMFSDCISLKSLALKDFDTSQVTNMNAMFDGCRSLTSLDLSEFVTDKVTDMMGMFQSCFSLENLIINSFNTSKVTTMTAMFHNCSSLTSLNLSNFVTSNVIYMSTMFNNCDMLKNINLTSFDTSSVTDMQDMFSYCESLKSLNLVSFNTPQVTNMSFMFQGCGLLKELNINNFNTTNVTTLRCMFAQCPSLTELNLSSFVISSSVDITGMFAENYKLIKIYCPTECNTTITLLKTYVEKGTTTEYSTITIDTNNKILVINPTFVELSTDFVSLLSQYNIENLTITHDASKQITDFDYEVDVAAYYSDVFLMANIKGKDCVIYSDLIIRSPEDSSNLFSIKTLKNVNLEGLDTSQTTNMNSMFVTEGHVFTIKGYLNFLAMLQGVASPYVDGMTFVEFAALMGLGTFETEVEAHNAVETKTGLKWAKTGEYDISLKGSGLSYSTFNELHGELTSTTCTETEEQCKMAVEEMSNCKWSYVGFSTSSITSLNISNFVINEGTNVQNMFLGLTNLQTMNAPAECGEDITLPTKMVEQGTTTEHSSLSNASNGKTLVLASSGETPTTGFVDEQLLPALAIGLVSIVAVMFVWTSNKKQKRI